MAIRRFDIPERVYTDNGSAFRSRHLAHVAAMLGIHPAHTGKIPALDVHAAIRTRIAAIR